MKNIYFKAWPELTAYHPSTTRIERSSASEHSLFLDFSGCLEISSTGLTVWLLRILSFIKQSSSRRNYSTELFSNNDLLFSIRQLSFFYHLDYYANNNDMFDTETGYDGPFELLHHYSFNNRKTISLPIYCFNLRGYKKEERRNASFPFRKMLMEELRPFEKSYNLNICQFITILTEMLKNSADHTDDEAFFGLDIVNMPEKDSIAIHFVLGDMGCGIKKNIQDYLLSPEAKKKRVPHMSFSDAYHFALTRGCTTKPNNKNNKGLGMTLIREGSQGVNMDISMFDAFSRCLLSSISKITHEELRKYFFPFTKDQTQPFYYYGVIMGEKR
jgi:hypothetical protein